MALDGPVVCPKCGNSLTVGTVGSLGLFTIGYKTMPQYAGEVSLRFTFFCVGVVDLKTPLIQGGRDLVEGSEMVGYEK